MIFTYNRIIILMALFYMTLSQAQTNTMDYTLEGTLTKVSETNLAITSKITKKGNQLVWEQTSNNINRSDQFVISGTSGSWDSSNSQGEITHSLTKDGYNLSFKLTGTENDLSALLKIQKDGASEMLYSFTITQITYQ